MAFRGNRGRSTHSRTGRSEERPYRQFQENVEDGMGAMKTQFEHERKARIGNPGLR
jgi:hypothetical protein